MPTPTMSPINRPSPSISAFLSHSELDYPHKARFSFGDHYYRMRRELTDEDIHAREVYSSFILDELVAKRDGKKFSVKRTALIEHYVANTTFIKTAKALLARYGDALNLLEEHMDPYSGVDINLPLYVVKSGRRGVVASTHEAYQSLIEGSLKWSEMLNERTLLHNRLQHCLLRFDHIESSCTPIESLKPCVPDLCHVTLPRRTAYPGRGILARLQVPLEVSYPLEQLIPMPPSASTFTHTDYLVRLSGLITEHEKRGPPMICDLADRILAACEAKFESDVKCEEVGSTALEEKGTVEISWIGARAISSMARGFSMLSFSSLSYSSSLSAASSRSNSLSSIASDSTAVSDMSIGSDTSTSSRGGRILGQGRLKRARGKFCLAGDERGLKVGL